VKELIEGHNELYYIERPDELAINAVLMTEEQGSSTLVILTIHPITGVMRSYHVGDSVYGIFKDDGSHILAE